MTGITYEIFGSLIDKVNDSEEVKTTNSLAFSKVFKQYTQSSPSSYRKQATETHLSN
ncbi:hypothetical protein [Lactobacillus helveticus]|nr:hypothetical protein [Lactobacillus helveticus]